MTNLKAEFTIEKPLKNYITPEQLMDLSDSIEALLSKFSVLFDEFVADVNPVESDTEPTETRLYSITVDTDED